MSIIVVVILFVLVPISWAMWFVAGYSMGKTAGLRESRDSIKNLRRELQRTLLR